METNLMKMIDLTGQKFGMLTVIRRGTNTKGNKCTWICKCDCGREKKKAVAGYDLKTGKVTSCGCMYKISNKGRNRTHGMTQTRIWTIWQGMIRRCEPTSNNRKNYYQKGITVCDEWKSFINFYEWAISNGYDEKLTLDRIDNSKGYYPANCRWTDYKTQERNRCNNRRITINGETHVLSEWGEITGINPETISWRLNHNWEENELFIKPNYANKWRRKDNVTE